VRATPRLHHEDSYLLEFEATVLVSTVHEGRPAVVLDRTAFYPESGGQPSDRGLLGEARVTGVIERDGEVLHLLDRALPTGPTQGRVDGTRRADHRQQHHGQHLLSRAFVETAGAETVAFHLGEEVTTIDLDRAVDEAAVRAAEELASEVVAQGRPVRVSLLTRERALAEALEVPPEAGPEIRVVEAEGFDRQPCGGTHPRSTAEVGPIVVLDHARYKGGTRVSFVCGRRAREAVRARLRALEAAAASLSAPWEQLAEAVGRVQEQARTAEKRREEAQAAFLRLEARRLVAEAAGPVVTAVYDGWEPADLRLLALETTRAAPCVALLGSRGAKAHLVFARTPGSAHDVAGALQRACLLLGGRGGGRGDVVQGGGDDPHRLEAALSRAAAELSGSS
jgi:alanyl-tRNA synthetase